MALTARSKSRHPARNHPAPVGIRPERVRATPVTLPHPERMLFSRAVFLDKDGTLVYDIPYNIDPAAMQLYSDAAESLRRLALAGFLLVVVSNQPGVAFGFYGEEAVCRSFRYVHAALTADGVSPDAYVYCPHHPGADNPLYRKLCGCRKPAPGMLYAAARRLGIDLAASWLVGDILDDIEAGNRAGCRSLLLMNGGETEWRPGEYRRPFRQIESVSQAADVILANMGGISNGHGKFLEGIYKPPVHQAR